MIQVDRAFPLTLSSNKVSSLAIQEIRGQHIKQWKTRSKSFSPKKIPPSIGTRIDNRKWGASAQSINALNVYTHHEEVAVLYGIRDPIETICQRGVEVPRPDAVRTYLRHYPELSELLNYASKISQQIFGTQTQLSLEIYRDIETNDEYLTLYVRQNKYDPELMKKIKQIRRKYRDLAKGTKGRFLLTTDFRSPG